MTTETTCPTTSITQPFELSAASYMSSYDIQQMAEAALVSYEGTASWSAAYSAAVEFAADEWHIKVTPAQAKTAVRLAQTGWEGIQMSVKATLMGANQ